MCPCAPPRYPAHLGLRLWACHSCKMDETVVSGGADRLAHSMKRPGKGREGEGEIVTEDVTCFCVATRSSVSPVSQE